MNKIGIIVAGCCAVLWGCSDQPNSTNLTPAKVTQVISGQTVEVRLIETSKVVKLRITGIDAPDLRQSPWGKTAKKKLSELVIGLSIQLEIVNPKRDRFGRLHGHIWQNQTLISQKLIQEGYVLANTRYNHSYSKLLIEAQEYARLMGYGIWNPQQAMRYTPNQFRSKIK